MARKYRYCPFLFSFNGGAIRAPVKTDVHRSSLVLCPRGEKLVSSTQFLGRDMRIYKEASLNNRVEVDEKKLHLYVTDVENEDLVQRVFSKWWRQTAESVYRREVDQYYYSVIRKYGIDKPDISIRKMKTLWGSCTPNKNKITLNEYLLKANIRCVQYVVLHELTHLLYPNHNSDFYDFLTIHMPDWMERKKQLDTEVVQGL